MDHREHDSGELNVLLGCTITRITVSDDDVQMLFETDHGDFGFVAWGDCCSEAWFADFLGVQNLLNHKVVKIEALEMSVVSDARTRGPGAKNHWEDCVYGYQFQTTAGHATLIFRNSNNGFYGGELLPGEADRATIEITDDWSA